VFSIEMYFYSHFILLVFRDNKILL